MTISTRAMVLALIGLPCLSGCQSAGPMTSSAQVRLSRGDQAMQAANIQAALAEFKEAVKLDPLLAEAHSKLGLAYKQSGDLNSAADSLETAIKLDPRDFTTAFELGEVYRLLEKVGNAVRAYALACKLQPGNFESHFRLASCYQQTGEMDQAIDTYRDALKIDARNAKAWSNLGAAYDTKGQHYEAIQAYKRSLECETDQPITLVNLATVYMNQDRFDAGQKTLEAALKIDPNLSIAHERMGYCHWRAQRLTDAATSYRRAIDLNRRNARALAGLGVVRMTQFLATPSQMALRDEAIEVWHQSLEIDANQPKLRELLEKYRPKVEKPALTFE